MFLSYICKGLLNSWVTLVIDFFCIYTPKKIHVNIWESWYDKTLKTHDYFENQT